ncbi:MAG: hypothetical protein EON60_05910 [Alphaproteobacteria bacterium]|nr:MAG: hypothetical protein EON60_05910 [Alphaproteobacteria bacterium]
MELHIFYLTMFLALGVAGFLAFWAAFGGVWGRWIAAGTLVAWVLWMGAVVVRQTHPHWLYTPAEQTYMSRLNKAVEQGRERVLLRELVPFQWQRMCFVSAPYHRINNLEAFKVKQLTGVDVAMWFEQKREPSMLFVTAHGTVIMRDFSKAFWNVTYIEKKPVYESYYESRGHYVAVTQGDGEEKNVFCDVDGDDVYMKINKL